MMVLANDSIEVFGNEFADNDSANVMIVSYFITERPFDDPNYDPFPESIYIHDNSFSGGGASPDSEPLNLLKQATGQDIPDIVWDGVTVPGATAAVLCISDNGKQALSISMPEMVSQLPV